MVNKKKQTNKTNSKTTPRNIRTPEEKERISRKYDCIASMPPLMHKVPDDDFSYFRSEVAEWLVNQKDILDFICQYAFNSKRIEFIELDPFLREQHLKENTKSKGIGFWIGVDYLNVLEDKENPQNRLNELKKRHEFLKLSKVYQLYKYLDRLYDWYSEYIPNEFRKNIIEFFNRYNKEPFNSSWVEYINLKEDIEFYKGFREDENLSYFMSFVDKLESFINKVIESPYQKNSCEQAVKDILKSLDVVLYSLKNKIQGLASAYKN